MRTTLILILISFVLNCSGLTNLKEQPVQKVLIEVQAVDTTKVTIDKEPEDKVNKSMDVHNPEGKLSHLSFTSGGKAFIKIFSGLSVSDVSQLWNDLVVLENNTSIRDVNLFINSPGGDAFSGLALADQIEQYVKKGFKITAHASGIIASAAVPVFAVCSKRFAAPGTIFMVHEAALWKWPGRETASDIRSQNDLMRLLSERYIWKLVNNSKLSKLEWEAMEKETTWFSAAQAKKYGIVDEIE